MPTFIYIGTPPTELRILEQYAEQHIDHLKGKYAEEVEDALNPLGKYKLVDETKSD